MKSRFSIGLIFKFVVLGLSWTMAYNLAFLQYTLYDPMLETFGCSNAQLGLLLTIFGIFNILGAPIGGWLCDKFNCKAIYVGSMIVLGLFSALLLFNTSYSMAVVVWILRRWRHYYQRAGPLCVQSGRQRGRRYPRGDRPEHRPLLRNCRGQLVYPPGCDH